MTLRRLLRQRGNKKLQKIPAEKVVRYYFWEDAPYYGNRQTGMTNGYDTLKELESDNERLIQRNQERGIPCWVMKSTFYKKYV